MKILLTNDDGVDAPGLAALEQQLRSMGDIMVVAPSRDRSASSNALTIDRPLRIRRQSSGFYAVDGTPTDCVHLSITGWLDYHPDMVIAGINRGANLGDDLLYSGTVAAAMEGRYLGYPAMALSLAGITSDDNPIEKSTHYTTAALIAKKLLQHLLGSPLPQDTILNINVPDLPIEALRGFAVTRLGHRHLAENVIPSQDPRGDPIYWIGPAGKEQDAGPGTDFYAINQGMVSITPIKVDLTDHAALDRIRDWANLLCL